MNYFNIYVMFLFLAFSFMFLGLFLLSLKMYLIFEISFGFVFLTDMNLFFYVDWLASLFIFVVFFISAMTFYYSESYMLMEYSNKQKQFLILTFLFVVSMFFMILSMNLYFIMLGWDGLGMISFCLVIFYYSESSNYSGVITVLTNRLGDIGLIMAMSFMFSVSSLDINSYSLNNVNCFLFIFLILVSSFTKSAQYPFFSWLPLAMAAPTPISALVHSSTLVTAGIYLIIRFNFFFSLKELVYMNFFYLSIFTMFFAGFSAFFEQDFKKIIALSTLSQLGLMGMILISGYPLVAFYHLLTHAMFKALLFLCSGVFIHESLNNQDVRNFSSVYYKNPLVSSIFMISSFSLMGFPFMSGFYSKDMILELIYMNNYSYLTIFIIFLSTFFTGGFFCNLAFNFILFL